MQILQEAAKSKYVKKFKCPYCGTHYERQKLISHIENKHPDEIPEGYSATRVVFNLINKKDHGTCVICGKETPWNPTLARYDRFCSEECKNKYVAMAKSRMIKTYGVDNLIYDPEQQKKMLQNRKISGIYKFSTGGELTYTGSYEKKALEFLDKVMEYKVTDVETPGPIVEYIYKGKKHIWITDIYIPAYHLAIDCKDGGDNKNMREMKEYREKQIEKEKAIAKQGKYNYLRLTDNNFGQLMSILAELKLQLIENNPNKIIRINENMFAGIGSMMPMGNPFTNVKKGDVYIMNYLMNNVFAGTAISDTPTFENAYIRTGSGVTVKTSVDHLFENDIKYSVYKAHLKEDTIDRLEEMAKSKVVSNNSILETIFERAMYTDDEWRCYDNVEKVNDFYDYLYQLEAVTVATLSNVDETSIVSLDKKYDFNSIVRIKEDTSGYFLENSITGLRTPSQSTKEFTDTQRSIIEKGFLR